MYLIAHAGLGYAMVEVWPAARKQNLSIPYLMAGAMLPDIIDKTLYYGAVFVSGRHSIGLLTGTRTFGHTVLFFLACLAIASWQKSKNILALTLGVLTHLILDAISDLVLSHGQTRDFRYLTWPFGGGTFPVMPYQSVGDHLSHWLDPFSLTMEALGIVFLIFMLYSQLVRRHSSKK